MPLMHFTRVDLPAPLSPTSAVTSPEYTEKSTSRNTWTGPKALFKPRGSRVGVPDTTLLVCVPVLSDPCGKTFLCGISDTQLSCADETRVNGVFDVVRIDRSWGEQYGRY